MSVDTNVLLRAVVRDDERQAALADEVLRSASPISVGMTSLCEFAWVLRNGYKLPAQQVAAAIRTLADSRSIRMNTAAVAAGLAVLDAGGDFADGVIAYEGAWLGAETFVSFDRKAVRLLIQNGVQARLLS